MPCTPLMAVSSWMMVDLVSTSALEPGYAMKNVIAPAQDARITVDGIEITRDRNDGLTDVIRGVTLTVKRPSQHEIDLNVEHSIETSVEKIKKFVEAYNKYLDMHRELTKAALSQKPGDYDKSISQKGLFMGDMTLMRLQGTLQVAAQFVGSVERHQSGHGDEAAVALGQLRPLPHVAEQHRVAQLTQLGDELVHGGRAEVVGHGGSSVMCRVPARSADGR